ncbi:MAG TPA: hypothetical protein PLB12_12505 [Candidatus Goldiibacteriota bacterium]|nr:hypothetical protein [Candidatus Goldiibacteriota bacterium]HRQ45160.1 hypothetical protein [Candidatus Goldiibacteriota bacterium]
MEKEMEKAFDKYPKLRKEYDIKRLKKYVNKAAFLGMRGIAPDLIESGDNNTIALVLYLAHKQAVYNETFSQAAELYAFFFIALIKTGEYEAAKGLVMDLCFKKTGYIREVLSMMASCHTLIKMEEGNNCPDKEKPAIINSSMNLLKAHITRNKEALLKEDLRLSKIEKYNELKFIAATAFMTASLLSCVVGLLRALHLL